MFLKICICVCSLIYFPSSFPCFSQYSRTNDIFSNAKSYVQKDGENMCLELMNND